MSGTLKIRIGIWLAVLALITGLYFWRKSTRPSKPPQPSVAVKINWEPRHLDLDDYQLVERSGRPFKFSELNGQVWLASFFFAECPGPCKLMNNRIAEVQRALQDKPVTIVSISVDPKNDTPERLQAYAQQFGADDQKWLFVSGSADDVSRLARELLAGVGVRQDGEREVAHSEKVIPVDRQGRMHFPMSVSSDADVRMVIQKVRQLLAEKEDKDKS